MYGYLQCGRAAHAAAALAFCAAAVPLPCSFLPLKIGVNN